MFQSQLLLMLVFGWFTGGDSLQYGVPSRPSIQSTKPMMEVARADKAVVQAGLVSTRAQAKVLIKAGLLLTPNGPVKRPAEMVNAEALMLAPGTEDVFGRFVSRAGYKLEACLETSLGKDHVEVVGCRALDVGASTGGFTDCLLQRGAASVVAIDVGHGQLHPRIASHPRVESFEGVNARSITARELERMTPANAPEQSSSPPLVSEMDSNVCEEHEINTSISSSFLFDMVVIDVSFISLSLVLPNIWHNFVNPSYSTVICLVKPQFEVGSLDDSDQGLKALHKGKGVVNNDGLRRKALEKIVALHKQLEGASVAGYMECPVKGTDGNVEWLLVLKRGKYPENQNYRRANR